MRDLRIKGINVPIDEIQRYKDIRRGIKLSSRRKSTEDIKTPIPIDELERFTEPNIFATNQQQGQPVSPPSGQYHYLQEWV